MRFDAAFRAFFAFFPLVPAGPVPSLARSGALAAGPRDLRDLYV